MPVIPAASDMKTYLIKAFVDSRPVMLGVETVEASTWAAAFRKAMTIIKIAARRGTKEISIKLVKLN